MMALGFVLAAVVGGATRFLVTNTINGRWPVGTLLVNLSGAFLAGLFHGLTGGSAVVVTVAGLGSLTSVSTVADEVAALAEGDPRAGVAYLVVTAAGGVGAALAGISLA